MAPYLLRYLSYLCLLQDVGISVSASTQDLVVSRVFHVSLSKKEGFLDNFLITVQKSDEVFKVFFDDMRVSFESSWSFGSLFQLFDKGVDFLQKFAPNWIFILYLNTQIQKDKFNNIFFLFVTQSQQISLIAGWRQLLNQNSIRILV